MKKSPVFLILLAAALVVQLAACGANAPTWQDEYDLGCRYLSEGNYQEAILAFTAAIEIDPAQPLAYIGRADAYCMAPDANYPQAEEDYRTAISLDPSIPEIYEKLAELYNKLGDPDAAREILEEGFRQTGDPDLDAALSEPETLSGDPIQPADFIGLPPSALFDYYGTDYIMENYAGSTFLIFDGSPEYYFGEMVVDYSGEPVKEISDDLLIRQVIAYDRHILVDNIPSAATYPELVAAVGEEVTLEEPTYYFNEMDDTYAYSLSFYYQEYHLSYTWYEDPMTNPSAFTWLQNTNVPAVPGP